LIIKLPKNTTSSTTSVFDSTIAAAAAVTDTMHVTFFVFSCPENAHIRMKMIMSSSKVSLPSSSLLLLLKLLLFVYLLL
jgi:hypothetical protein